ncbi:MAG TPA: polysaccharide deacetylase family protein [Thermoanaerobaculia bacterium]|nr:polysaccharide deacetylase family protein [Thermoanaerobaculia bacterium]HQR67930.1 polysaccharide deacetylase family protein [Thermoanaerobaculia bacterium]
MVLSPVLTVDVEEWFHVCGEPAYADPAGWPDRPSRVEEGVGRILDLLGPTRSRATFFVLGWVARKFPELVLRIRDAGHEVGCHGDLHQRVYELDPAAFRADLVRSRDTLEDLLGARVTSYRAPEWSIRSADNPALAILVEEGFALDSSLVDAPPVGVPGNPSRPAVIATPSGPILEVPPLMGTFFLRRAIWGGGVCMRLTRFSRVNAAFERALAGGAAPVLYCHPWEFDDDHPPMPDLSVVGRLVKFAGRRRTEARLRRWIARHTFVPISSVAA